MADFETIRDAHNELVRANLHFAILFDDIDNDAVQTLEDTATGDLVLPETAESAGIIEKGAGVSLTHDITSKDIEGYGDAEPVRTIISKRSVKFKANFLETNKVVLEKFWGTVFDDSNMTISANGGVTIIAPTLPDNIYYRAYLVAEDDVNGKELYTYYIMPRVKLVDVDSQDSKDDDAYAYGMTFQAFKDSELGFAVLQGWCGPGWLSLVDKTGFVAAPTAITATATDVALLASTHETSQIIVTASNGLNVTPLAKYSITGAAIGKATVDKNGLVRANAAGSVPVAVTYMGKTSTVTFTVT